MAGAIIKKIIPKVIKKAPKKKKKGKAPLEIKPGKNVGKTNQWGDPIVVKGSPYETVDELSTPLHRSRGAPGVEKKKLKEAGERISKWFRKKDGKVFKNDYTQPKLPHLKKGGLIKGFPKIATKGWK